MSDTKTLCELIPLTDRNVVVIHINANKMNVITHLFLDQLEAAITTASSEFPQCGLLLVGNDRAFSAGLDLQFLQQAMKDTAVAKDTSRPPVQIGSRHPYYNTTAPFIPQLASYRPSTTSVDEVKPFVSVISYVDRVCQVGQLLFNYPRPTTAAITGHAIAGGTFFAACCTYRVSLTEEAFGGKILFGLNEVVNGFQVPVSFTQIIKAAFHSSYPFFIQTTLQGQLFGLKDAVKHGFIHATASTQAELLELGLQYAHLPARSMPAFACAKRMIVLDDVIPPSSSVPYNLTQDAFHLCLFYGTCPQQYSKLLPKPSSPPVGSGTVPPQIHPTKLASLELIKYLAPKITKTPTAVQKDHGRENPPREDAKL